MTDESFVGQCTNRAMRMMMGIGIPRKSRSSERIGFSGVVARTGHGDDRRRYLQDLRKTRRSAMKRTARARCRLRPCALCPLLHGRRSPLPCVASVPAWRRLSAFAWDHLLAQLGIQTGCRAHIGVHHAGVEIVLGLDDLWVWCCGHAGGRFIALMRQWQTFATLWV